MSSGCTALNGVGYVALRERPPWPATPLAHGAKAPAGVVRLGNCDSSRPVFFSLRVADAFFPSAEIPGPGGLPLERIGRWQPDLRAARTCVDCLV